MTNKYALTMRSPRRSVEKNSVDIFIPTYEKCNSIPAFEFSSSRNRTLHILIGLRNVFLVIFWYDIDIFIETPNLVETSFYETNAITHRVFRYTKVEILFINEFIFKYFNSLVTILFDPSKFLTLHLIYFTLIARHWFYKSNAGYCSLFH